MATIKKVEISPVVPIDVSHHCELPAGNYVAVLTGFRQKICLIRRLNDGSFFFVNWLGLGQILGNFVVHANGDLEFDDPNDCPSPC